MSCTRHNVSILQTKKKLVLLYFISIFDDLMSWKDRTKKFNFCKHLCACLRWKFRVLQNICCWPEGTSFIFCFQTYIFEKTLFKRDILNLPWSFDHICSFRHPPGLTRPCSSLHIPFTPESCALSQVVNLQCGFRFRLCTRLFHQALRAQFFELEVLGSVSSSSVYLLVFELYIYSVMQMLL